jgi:hypothetical protein
MASRFSIPSATQPPPKGMELHPKKARAWVESLPRTKIIESGRAVPDVPYAIAPNSQQRNELRSLKPTARRARLLDELDAVYAFATLPPAQQHSASGHELSHR